MRKSLFLLVSIILLGLLTGCSNRSNPILSSPDTPNQLTSADLSLGSVHHALLGYGSVSYDPATNEGYFHPNREAMMHLNVEPYLVSFCSNPSGCIRVGNIRPSPAGNLLADVTIEHPLTNDSFSVFDLRVIVMMDTNVTHFPALNVNVSEALLNCDGYTSLWDNASIPGDINPFKAYNRYISRRKFQAGSTVTETLEVKIPDGPLVFDIGVDASWAPKVGGNFPPEANAPEAVEITTYTSGTLTPTSGSLTVDATVIDTQGYETIWTVEMDCNGIFNGPWPMAFESGDGTVATYTATVSNSLHSPIGIYDILIKVRDFEDLSNPLDLCAYKIAKVVVGTEGGANSIQIIKPIDDVNQYINLGSGNYSNSELEITAVAIPPVAGVYIDWSFDDPDEPSTRPAADESQWYETDTTPNDNHGTSQGFKEGTAVKQTITTVTDGTGTSTVKFRVSSWAGDNYHILAERVSTQETASSPLITVWRKYYVRNDNMKSSGGVPGYYKPRYDLVNSESYAQCYILLEISDGPVQTIPYQNYVYIDSGLLNWCRTKTGFTYEIDKWQLIGVNSLYPPEAVGVSLVGYPHCICAEGALDDGYENEVSAHEIGHLFGMDHVDTHSLMYPAVDGHRQFLRSQITDLRNGPPLQP
jgi:hypothetical protein